MAEDTDWQTLRSRCTDNKCRLALRAETFGSEDAPEYRYALTAKNRLGETVYELRTTNADNAPQYTITTMVSAALDDWWVVV